MPIVTYNYRSKRNNSNILWKFSYFANILNTNKSLQKLLQMQPNTTFVSRFSSQWNRIALEPKMRIQRILLIQKSCLDHGYPFGASFFSSNCSNLISKLSTLPVFLCRSLFWHNLHHKLFTFHWAHEVHFWPWNASKYSIFRYNSRLMHEVLLY